MVYHGKLCSKCFQKGKQVELYIRSSKEANKYWKKKLQGKLYLERSKTECVSRFNMVLMI